MSRTSIPNPDSLWMRHLISSLAEKLRLADLSFAQTIPRNCGFPAGFLQQVFVVGIRDINDVRFNVDNALSAIVEELAQAIEEWVWTQHKDFGKNVCPQSLEVQVIDQTSPTCDPLRSNDKYIMAKVFVYDPLTWQVQMPATGEEIR